MPRNKVESSQYSLFNADVADTTEIVAGDVEQVMFQAEVKSDRRGASPAQHDKLEPLNAADLTQTGLFEESEQREIRTLKDCFVTMKPVVEETQKTQNGKTIKREEWKCTFTSPPDLWHIDSPTIIHASAINPETIELAKKAKLKRGNYVTITGIVTNEHEQPMGKGAEPRQIIYLILTEIKSVLRPSSAKTKTNIVPLRARRG